MRQYVLFLIWMALMPWETVIAANSGKLRLPSIFASGMVLQQQADVEIWGWAAPRTEVVVNTGWDDKTNSGISDANGRWIIKVTTPKADNTPHALSIENGNEHIHLSDVLIGDVWFVSGQSNMQMSFTGNPDQPVENAQKILLRSKHPNMRLFRVEPGYSLQQSDTISIDGAWYPADPDNVSQFSVVGYIFGEKNT